MDPLAPRLNGRSIIPRPVEAAVVSDASLAALGATVSIGEQKFRFQHHLSPEESAWTSNRRELHAILEAVIHFKDLLRGKMVEIFSDNSASVACVNLQGSRTAWLNAAASKLWEFCLSKKISLRATHIPGESNIEADALSRWLIDDPLGYQLNPAIFVKIEAQLGPLSVDLFASSVNRLLPRFYSWLFDPEAEAVDAMRQDWPLGAYAHPPLKLLERFFALLPSRARGSVILIAPTWPSAPWWPLLLKHETRPPLDLGSLGLPILLPCGNALPPKGWERWKLQAWTLSAKE